MNYMPKAKKTKHSILDFNAVFLEEKDGGYSVSVPALPGCFSEGDTFEEAMKNIQEAIGLYIEHEKNHDFFPKVRREFMAPVQIYG